MSEKTFKLLKSIILAFTLVAAVIGFCLPFCSEAENGKINLLVDVQPSLALITSDTSIDFGILIAGNPQTGGHGVQAAVSTNAANGYYLAIADNAPAGQSSLKQSDGQTAVADFSANIDNPETYVKDHSKGLGITVYSATSAKESKWGNGTNYDDLNNHYAGIPGMFTVIHLSPSYKDYIDYTDIAFILDVPSNQKTGEYHGSLVLSAIAMLN